MANPEHLKIIKNGVKAWNHWREEANKLQKRVNSTEHLLPDLSRADLRKVDLYGVDFSFTNLDGAILVHTDLRHADLRGSDLTRTDLGWSILKQAHLEGANLKLAYLDNSILNSSNLSGANLSWTDLHETSFIRANLFEADFTKATMSGVAFGANDLSTVKGLDKVSHAGPSMIDIRTIYLSKGNIPEVFLHGAGIQDNFITYMRSLTEHGIQFYSCFISFSSRDREFAQRLHADLQVKGVRVWFAPHNMSIGARIRPTIDESIRVYDKLLLVLSETSVNSQWVEQEVETALRKERQSGDTALFPVRLDDTVLEIGEGWPALIKDTRHIGDFTRWKEHDSYQKAFELLLRDLKAGARDDA